MIPQEEEVIVATHSVVVAVKYLLGAPHLAPAHPVAVGSVHLAAQALVAKIQPSKQAEQLLVAAVQVLQEAEQAVQTTAVEVVVSRK